MRPHLKSTKKYSERQQDRGNIRIIARCRPTQSAHNKVTPTKANKKTQKPKKKQKNQTATQHPKKKNA